MSLVKIKKLNSKDIKNLEIPSLNYQKAYDFYTITPIVSYSLGGQDFSSYTPGVMFNILMSDEEKIKVIRDN
ncbi:hypothetical protein [Planococcus shixiaomingii]|uniref:hypothetical protein n=1 Tax=Planococcus shixiaomingii TaxID=3058393 RepID=UPI00265B4D08|nr:hypothetical protein [Planococcus sp. N028]